VKVVQNDKVLAEVPYFVERSLVVVAPPRVRAESFTVQVKGIGWTELDNGFTVTYDNSTLATRVASIARGRDDVSRGYWSAEPI
jgi:hypothetical protein